MNDNRSDLIQIGKNISELRKKKGYTQKALGEIIDVNDKTISKWENGDIAPDITILNLLAKALSTDINVILNGDVNNLNQIDTIKHKNNKLWRELFFLIFGFLIGLLIFFVLFYKTDSNCQRFDVNSDWYISGFIVENDEYSSFVIDEFYYREDDSLNNKYVNNITIRVVQDGTIIYEETFNFSDCDGLKQFLHDYNLIINNPNIIIDSKYHISIYFVYNDNDRRTFEYDL